MTETDWKFTAEARMGAIEQLQARIAELESELRIAEALCCEHCPENRTSAVDLEDIRIGEDAAGPADVADQIHRRLPKAYSAKREGE